MGFIRENWLDAVSSPQATDPVEVMGRNIFTLQVSTTGSPTEALVYLEGSVDGEKWSALVIQIDEAETEFPASIGSFGPLRYVRLRLASLIGGTSPTVSASVMAMPATF